MECPRGNSRSRTAQIRGKLKDELSQSRAKPFEGEGVETRRAAPTAFKGYGEGIVQTTNALAAAAKVEVVRKSAPREGVGVRVPRPHHHRVTAFDGVPHAPATSQRGRDDQGYRIHGRRVHLAETWPLKGRDHLIKHAQGGL